MKWVTRDFVHLDRVACPWLIKRFIDVHAEFVFVPWGEEAKRPADAIAFAIPGAELGPHDANGTTFTKLIAKYKINDPSIAEIAKVIHAGVDYVLHGYRPGAEDRHGQIAVGLLAVSEGVLLVNETDNAIIDASLPIYDALYANFRAHQLVKARGASIPDSAGRGPTRPTLFLRGILKDQ
ncbi:MAG: chromate resistance protein [Betaproteobacteria bacterium]|nr:chromate resistance protein [Betaproteobacteria bacterium]